MLNNNINIPSGKYDTKAIKDRLAAKSSLPPATQVKDNLISWFMYENPPADNVMVVSGSLKQSQRNPAYWEAVVQTVVYFPYTGPKTHNSRVFFYVDSRYNIINRNVNFKS